MRNIKKILFISFWIAIGSATLVLLVAAIRSRNDTTCKDIAIQVNGVSSKKWLLGRNEIIHQLTNNGAEKIKGRELQSFDLRSMEERLERHVWIKDAELFFDNNAVMQVRLKERIPVARVFTRAGGSFYIDSSGKRLPLSDRLTMKLPLFTGFPTDKKLLRQADSLLLKQVLTISKYLYDEPFWKAQLAQIDITPARNFEMIPTVGDHLIEFGTGDQVKEKFSKMLLFYKQVLAGSGLNRYERIKLQYQDQVIGVKKTTFVSKADSLAAVKNIRRLIESAQDMQQAIADSASKSEMIIADSLSSSKTKKIKTKTRKNQPIAPKPKAVMQP